VLTGVQDVDMSVTVMGQALKMPIFCSPTALQRLFHHEGERAVARAAEKFGTFFGVTTVHYHGGKAGYTDATDASRDGTAHQTAGITASVVYAFVCRWGPIKGASRYIKRVEVFNLLPF